MRSLLAEPSVRRLVVAGAVGFGLGLVVWLLAFIVISISFPSKVSEHIASLETEKESLSAELKNARQEQASLTAVLAKTRQEKESLAANLTKARQELQQLKVERVRADRSSSRPSQTASGTSPPTRSSWTATKEWYEGGTLHKKSALEWQTASSKDKLATCADFVNKMWQNGDLKPSIANDLSTVDDVLPYALGLVAFLDAAFKPDPDPEQNRRLSANQTVASTAAIGMVMMRWTK